MADIYYPTVPFLKLINYNYKQQFYNIFVIVHINLAVYKLLHNNAMYLKDNLKTSARRYLGTGSGDDDHVHYKRCKFDIKRFWKDMKIYSHFIQDNNFVLLIK